MGITQQGSSKPPVTVRARVLVVDDEPAMLELFRDVIAAHADCQILQAANLRQARQLLQAEPIDLLVTDMRLPDGDGLSLLKHLQKTQPGASAVVISGTPTADGAIGALRSGAIDFLAKPFSADVIADRMRRAIAQAKLRRHQNGRMKKLKDAVRRLNAARKLVSKKVDLLCNDLVSAYGELSKQMDSVRIQQGFKQFIDQSGGLEQLLCHTMDWLLRQLGYCNIGIWLATTEQELQLGAYMKYTIAAEPELTGALEKNLLRMAIRRGFLRLREPELKSHLSPIEVKHLNTQDILTISCTYLGETLGVMALFRDRKTPFSDDDVAAVKAICPLFALSLADCVRGKDGDDDAGPSEELGEEPPTQQPEKPKKKDPADWWKTGEAPPF